LNLNRRSNEDGSGIAGHSLASSTAASFALRAARHLIAECEPTRRGPLKNRCDSIQVHSFTTAQRYALVLPHQTTGSPGLRRVCMKIGMTSVCAALNFCLPGFASATEPQPPSHPVKRLAPHVASATIAEQKRQPKASTRRHPAARERSERCYKQTTPSRRITAVFASETREICNPKQDATKEKRMRNVEP